MNTDQAFTSRPGQTRRYLRIVFFFGLLGLATLLNVPTYLADIVDNIAQAQAAILGTWTAEISRDDKEGKLQLSLSRRTEKGQQNVSGSSFALADLPGLTREQIASAESDVNFRLVREAGTFEFAGTFRQGRGAGHFTLTPDTNFIAAMRARGYDNLNEEKLVAAAMLNVRTQAIDDLKAAGYEQLTLEDVFKATIFQVTPDFISEMRSLGYDHLALEELVKARIFKIDAAYAREVSDMGFGRQSLESLVKMRIFKVTPEFLREMRTAGLENLTIEDLVKLRIFKIDADFIKQARNQGVTSNNPEDFVRLRIHGGK